MGYLYANYIRPMLFQQDPEAAHDRVLGWLKLATRARPLLSLGRQVNLTRWARPVRCFGLEFPNAIGLAAGFDKNGEVWPVMPSLGFGHVEIGTVTLHRQPGNRGPRIFRLPEHEALVNKLGFPNNGAEALARQLAKQQRDFGRPVPLGINIGKSRGVELDEALPDYLGSLKVLAPFADYVAINVSSPNTPNLRRLQGKAYLATLLSGLREAHAEGANGELPLLLKISPDLSFKELDEVIEVALAQGVAGIIATNTTIERPNGIGKDQPEGGLSGLPLNQRAADIVKYLYLATSGKLPIIGVGGVVNEVTAGRLFDAGASLIQVYTGMVYQGPLFPRRLAKALSWSQRKWV